MLSLILIYLLLFLQSNANFIFFLLTISIKISALMIHAHYILCVLVPNALILPHPLIFKLHAQAADVSSRPSSTPVNSHLCLFHFISLNVL